jgi:hypothetical protein
MWTGATMKATHCPTRDRLVLAPVSGTGGGLALDDRDTHGLGTGSSASRRPETMINNLLTMSRRHILTRRFELPASSGTL